MALAATRPAYAGDHDSTTELAGGTALNGTAKGWISTVQVSPQGARHCRGRGFGTGELSRTVEQQSAAQCQLLAAAANSDRG